MKRVDYAVARAVPIERIMAYVGLKPITRTADGYFYLAPWRREKTPSLHVQISKNRWTDFGESGRSGSAIDLAMRLGVAKDPFMAATWLIETFDIQDCPNTCMSMVMPPQKNDEGSGSNTNNTSTRIIKVEKITNPYLFRYFSTRGIPGPILQKYCSQVTYRTSSKKEYYGVGFPNRSGGYAVRSQYAKITIAPVDISIIYNTTNRICCVFEGFCDFLSFCVLSGGDNLNLNYVVLNSVTMLSRALPVLAEYETVYLYLDNDMAGRQASRDIQMCIPGVASDMAGIYREHKDLNDYLMMKG